MSSSPAAAYSVLSHQAIIDSAWERSIVPVLERKYPGATAQELRKARAHAYGGAIIQDLGYYPFGNRQFSDLVHYFRSGDFVRNLILEARDRDEYAFALGALAHYAADNIGHSLAVNPAVAMLYPKLRSEFGDKVAFGDSPSSHVKTEFAFDVVQVARGRYAPDAWHDFIGFEVAKDVLDRGFERTYAVRLKDIFVSVDLALGTYRHTVSGLIPEMTKVAWSQKREQILKHSPGMVRDRFVYRMTRRAYEQEWGREYERPGFFSRLLGWILRVVPKVGPFKALGFRTPTPEAERLFLQSFDATVARYGRLLLDAGAGGLPALVDTNLDTGEPSRAGRYRIADEAVAELLGKLAGRDLQSMDATLRNELITWWGSTVPDDSEVAAALSRMRGAKVPGATAAAN